MKGASRSTKGKASRVKAGSRCRPFHSRWSWMPRNRPSHRGVKLATYSSSEGSPERPVKVVGGGADADGDGSRVCVPVFGGGDRIPRSSGKIGESAPSSESIPKMGAGVGTANEPVKLGAYDNDGSPGRIVNDIGRSRLRVDNLGQLYVLDSEEEDGGSCGGRRRLCPHRRLAAVRARLRLAAARARLAAADGANQAVDMALVADPAPEAAMAVDVPAGAANDPDLPRHLSQHVKVQLGRMEPIFHDTFLSILKIYLPACFEP